MITKTGLRQTNDLRIVSTIPLIPPKILKEEFPMDERSNHTVVESREVVERILRGEDKRLIAIVGPCSIHDVDSALEYAEKLAELARRIQDRVYVIMRVYFEKPRTTIGWRGLIIDPHLDGSYDIAEGLRRARKLLLNITGMGLPAGSEMLDPIVPQYIADLISWASIGARTTESQTHREMASGLSMPVGFKNGTDGRLETAVNALKSSLFSHSFIGIDQEGRTCVLKTRGNQAVHIILRGGKYGPNYYEENVEEVEELLQKEGVRPAVVIDCSHANSSKRYVKQSRVLHAVLDQRKRGRESIVGFMLESFLKDGRQAIPEDKSKLEYGKSVTDECVGWDKTEEMLMHVYNELKEVIT
ncbi:MAG: 3-deoxy-7-phosphoheptulonate synthase [Spirochaetes bacterium]|nr:MAG: 3-deoxy-7-phosphoheptulonate synthase [Spirochaetota bacterium]